MASSQGFLPPYTDTGRTALVPDMPWHYSGTLLTVEYRTDPARVRAILPPDLELADEDPGAVAFIWADWQSCSTGGAELLDPSRSQYLEAFVVVRAKFEGVTYSRCVLIWVTTDFAIGRGWFQGYPKKLGSVFVTRFGALPLTEVRWPAVATRAVAFARVDATRVVLALRAGL